MVSLTSTSSTNQQSSDVQLEAGFMLLQGNLLEDLRDLLSSWLTSHSLRPLENETILVQSNGIAQWLKMALARDEGGCGIAAAIDVDLPGRFLWQVYRSIFANLPKISPYDKAPLTWRLYRLLGDWAQLENKLHQLGEDSSHLEPLAGFLQQDTNPRRLHQLAANLADLYDQYQVYRADWLTAWEKKNNCLITAKGEEIPLEEANLWQAIIWRLLIAEIQADPQLPISDEANPWARASRATIHQAVIAECAKFNLAKRPAQLPRRVVVFGISSLPRQTLDLLHAIAPFTQILVFATNPSQHYWGNLVEGKDLLRREYKRLSERKINPDLNPEDLHIAGNPLLASWGKQGRDYLHLLDEEDAPDTYRHLFTSLDIYRSPLDSSGLEKNSQQTASLLNQLQDDIFELRSLEERQSLASQVDPETDSSLQFITAHSAQREVEILHDQLLHTFSQALAQGEPLAPRDILVMVPDINQYAPFIQAVFGRYSNKYIDQAEARDARFLPFHIADQSQRKQNTLLIALEKLLKLPTSRFTVSELLDLLDTPALRVRYGLAEADLPKLKEWIVGANIRWGLNAEQREQLGLPAQEQNTWLFGLRRLLLGFASGSAAWQGIEPHNEVAGLEAALLGPLAQLLDDLTKTLKQLQQEQTPYAWLTCIEELVARFFVETSKADSQALMSLEAQLENLADVWFYAGIENQQHLDVKQQENFATVPQLALEVIAEEVLSQLDQPNLTQKFLGGAINFATLMPMRAIPFQQIWLLGMNDGDYPRSVRPADFDLMAKDYRPGDRSRREDDRYLFLEALLAARKKLVISWVGRSQRDNSPRPPSVLVGQLRDYLAAGWQLAATSSQAEVELEEKDLLAALTQEHPLQAFSPRYFLQAAENNRLFTYAKEWQPLAHKQQPLEIIHQKETLPPWLPEGSINLSQLRQFLTCPTEALYQQRLKIYNPRQAEVANEVESFSFSGLEAWQIKDILIEQTFKLDLADYPQQLNKSLEQLTRQGVFIEGALGQLTSKEVSQELAELFEIWQEKTSNFRPLASPLTGSFSVVLAAEKLNLELQANKLFSRATANNTEFIQLLVQASNLVESRASYRWRNLVYPWLQHLVAQILTEQPTATYVLSPKGKVIFTGLELAEAQEQLTQLITFWWEGMQAPLPVALNLAMGWLGKQPTDETEQAAALLAAERGYKEDSQYASYFAHHFPSFADLAETAEFTHLIQAIYLPFYQAVKAAKKL